MQYKLLFWGLKHNLIVMENLKRIYSFLIAMLLSISMAYSQNDSKLYWDNISRIINVPSVTNIQEDSVFLIEKNCDFRINFDNVDILSAKGESFYFYKNNRIQWKISLPMKLYAIYSYNADGLLVKAENYSLPSTDIVRIMEEIKSPRSDRKQQICNFSYNSNREIITSTYIFSDGTRNVEKYTYDAKGRLKTVACDDTICHSFQYDMANRVTRDYTTDSKVTFQNKTGTYSEGEGYMYENNHVSQRFKTSRSTLWMKITSNAPEVKMLLGEALNKPFPVTEKMGNKESSILAMGIMINMEAKDKLQFIVYQDPNAKEIKENIMTYRYDVDARGNWITRYSCSASDGKIVDVTQREYADLRLFELNLEKEQIERRRQDSIRLSQQRRRDSVREIEAKKEIEILNTNKRLTKIVKQIETAHLSLEQAYKSHSKLAKSINDNSNVILYAKNKLWKTYCMIYDESNVHRINVQQNQFESVNARLIEDVYAIQQNMRQFRHANTNEIEKRLKKIKSLTEIITFLKEEAPTLIKK